jgi:hypothetical protein
MPRGIRPVHEDLTKKNRPDSEESGGSPYASFCLCADPAGRTLDVRLASPGIWSHLYACIQAEVKPFLPGNWIAIPAPSSSTAFENHFSAREWKEPEKNRGHM